MSTLQLRYALILLVTGLGGCTLAESRPNIEGKFDPGLLTNFDDPRWPIADLNCPFPCTSEGREYMTSLLNDPANSARDLLELRRQSQDFNIEYLQSLLTDEAKQGVADFDTDAEFDKCEPHGWVHTQAQPLPIQIKQFDERVEIRYDYWHSVRTVFTDGRGFPEEMELSRLGYSVGRYEGQSLLVETRGIEPRTLRIDGVMGLRNSQDAVVVERITKREGGDMLDIHITVQDPKVFKEPLVATPAFLSVPDAELGTFDCSTSTGDRLDELDE